MLLVCRNSRHIEISTFYQLLLLLYHPTEDRIYRRIKRFYPI